MGLFDTFATDAKAETEGRWFNYPKNKDGSIPGFRLARLARTNPRWQSAMERIGKDFKTEIKLDILDNDMAFEAVMEAFCDTVLLGWQNVYDKEEKVIEYSKENAIKLFKSLPALYDDLREKAASLSAYREIERETQRPN